MEALAQVFIVFVSRGEYSAYSVEQWLIGEVDPNPILDEVVRVRSEGRWQTQAEMDPFSNFREDELKSFVRAGYLEALKQNGFREVKATEVWLD